jgi:hypothetical protein
MNGEAAVATPVGSSDDRRIGLLLSAAFGDTDRALEAWQELAPVLDITTMAHDTHGVFGQLASVVRTIDPDSAVLPRLEGVHRRLWTMNSARVRRVLDARTALARAGVRAEPSGGLAVALRQPDLGQRPLVDAELAVAVQDAKTAERLLVAQGWRETSRRRDGWLLDLHAVTVRTGPHELTLRWCDTEWPYDGEDPDREPRRVLDGAEVRLPAPADLLAYTLIEGYRLWGYTPTRRLADTLLLLRDPCAVSWSRLVELSRERAGSVAVHRGLADAARVTDLVPQTVLADLQRDARGARSGLALAADRRVGSAAVLLRRTSGMSVPRAIGASPAVLRQVWEVPGDVSLVSAGARRLRAKLQTRAGQPLSP